MPNRKKSQLDRDTNKGRDQDRTNDYSQNQTGRKGGQTGQSPTDMDRGERGDYGDYDIGSVDRSGDVTSRDMNDND
jgi:hypothetical protein